MSRDYTDLLLERLHAAYPDIDVDPYRVTARLARIGEHLARHQEEVFGRLGLNRGEVGLLALLRMTGPPYRLSPGRLGRALLLSSAGITSRVDRLERRGLVRRAPDPQDRRGVLVELTADGADLIDTAVHTNAESDARLMARYSAAEMADLEALLRRLAVAFEPISEA